MDRDEIRRKILDQAKKQNRSVEELRTEWVLANQSDFFDTADLLHAILVSEDNLARVDRMILGINQGYAEPKSDLSVMLEEFEARILEIEQRLPDDVEI